jgi:cytochrome c oxidase cbb3-type subunit 2
MLDNHKKIEKNSVLLLVLAIVAVSIGGLVEIVPLFRIETTIEKVDGMRPYTPLELAGQNIYIREGCNVCHSQQIRALRDEVERYGHYSLAAESMYDHPFLWGSERTGPDLSRVGGKYSDEWHARHLTNPRDVVPQSIMPAYPHLAQQGVRLYDITKDVKVLQELGVPYTDDMVKNAYNDGMAQASASDSADKMKSRYGAKVLARDFDGNPVMTSELDALIAYLQVLGTMVDFKKFDADLTVPAQKVKKP